MNFLEPVSRRESLQRLRLRLLRMDQERDRVEAALDGVLERRREHLRQVHRGLVGEQDDVLQMHSILDRLAREHADRRVVHLVGEYEALFGDVEVTARRHR